MQTVLSYFGKELLVALLPAKQANEEDSGAVDGEEGADAVKFWRVVISGVSTDGGLTMGGLNGGFGGLVGSFWAGRLTTRENLQNDQREGELRESGPDVCALEGPTPLLIRVSRSFV